MIPLDQILEAGLNLAAQANASFAEAWTVEMEEKEIRVENGIVSHLLTGRKAGICMRVLVGNRWGFASGPVNGLAAVQRITAAALDGAKVAHKSLSPAQCQSSPVQAQWEGACLIDPFAIPNDELTELLQAADNAMHVNGIGQRSAFLYFRRQRRQYRNSQADRINHLTNLSGGGVSAMAAGEGELIQRSWPCPGGSYAGRGYEYIQELNLPGKAAEIARETAALKNAPPCPEGVRDLIISGAQLAMLIHHTCGRRAQLGAPGSFPARETGQFRFGSPHISIHADAGFSGGAGSFGYDLEGTKAKSFPVIQEGKFVGFFSGRDAASVGGQSSGSMRAFFLEPPAPRMTNLVLQAGEGSLQDLCAGTDRGLLLSAAKSFSISPSLQEFVAQAELGWLVENGKATTLVRNPIFKGNTTAFWSGCDSIAGLQEQEYLGVLDDGIAVGHLVVPIRIRGVKVGASL